MSLTGNENNKKIIKQNCNKKVSARMTHLAIDADKMTA